MVSNTLVSLLFQSYTRENAQLVANLQQICTNAVSTTCY
jgi:hypothetical protein